LRARQSLFSASGGPSGQLVDAHGTVDWQTVADERDAADPSTSKVTGAQLDALDDLLDLEEFDPRAVPEAVEGTLAPIGALGLDRIAEVTGDAPGDPGTVEYWLAAKPALGSVRARIDRTLDNPALYNDGAAPWLLKYDHDSAATLHDLAGGATVASYLDAFLAQPGWTIRYLDRQLSDPAALVEDLTAWLYSPETLSGTGDLASALQDLAGAVGDLPALEALFEGLPTGESSTRRAAFAAHLRTLAGALGSTPPSLADPASAESAFDSAATGATSDLADAAATERGHVESIQSGPAVDRAFRTVVLERLREPMTVAASYGVFGGTPTEPDADTPGAEAALIEQARALLARLRERLQSAAALDPRIEGGLAAQPVPQRVETQTDRLERLFGDGFTVLPPFSPSNPAELSATFGDGDLVPDEHAMAPETWLQRAATIRERVDGFREARSYAEALSGTLTPSLTIGQVPFEPGDTWVGIDGVDPEPGRISLVAQFGPGASPGTAGDRLTGLYIDEWTESVPAETETTGLALQYDDPGNRAPQSILLVPPPAGESWTLDHLAATVAETGEYMKRRAVDLGDLPADATHLLPALYFAQQSGTNRTTPSVNFGMVDWYDRDLVTALLPPGQLLYPELGGGNDE
jgi:hypothetical protein